MMEAVRTYETSVDNHFTRQYIPEDNSEHHKHKCSWHHLFSLFFFINKSEAYEVTVCVAVSLHIFVKFSSDVILWRWPRFHTFQSLSSNIKKISGIQISDMDEKLHLST
jgi:hypothetical protein